MSSQQTSRELDLALQPRRDFLKQAGTLALAASGVPVLAGTLDAAPKRKPPETLVKSLYDSLKEKQRKEVCFKWDHIDESRGLLRTRIEHIRLFYWRLQLQRSLDR